MRKDMDCVLVGMGGREENFGNLKLENPNIFHFLIKGKILHTKIMYNQHKIGIKLIIKIDSNK